MTLFAGFPLIVPDTFNLPIEWIDRILIGSGVDKVGTAFVAKPEWRKPESAELSLLLPDPSSTIKPPLTESLCLFSTSRHLTKAWSRVLEKTAAENGALTGFDRFGVEIARFLDIKDLPVPEGAAFELFKNQDGQTSLACEAQPQGFTFNLGDSAPQTPPPLWGAINLGAEAAYLVYINLSPKQMLTEVQKKQAFDGKTPEELGTSFLTLYPDYVPVRLLVEPAEGFRLPDSGLLIDAQSIGNKQPELLLLIRAPK